MTKFHTLNEVAVSCLVLGSMGQAITMIRVMAAAKKASPPLPRPVPIVGGLTYGEV
ncbi:MAG: hypothetical protein ACUVTH_07300 [Thermogutta sp.]